MTPSQRNVGYDGYVFDLDGTIYLSERLISGARETIVWLRDRGKGVVFVSNKPLYPRSVYAAKLTRLGIPTSKESVINSTRALVTFVKQVAPESRLYVLGEQALREELRQDGLFLTESVREIDMVVASFDRTLDYRKLNIAHQALVRGARFVATNADATCPVEHGGLPDCAGVIAFLEATTGRTLERVLGKPSPDILQAAMQHLSLERQQCLMVGDRLTTDMVMGINAGMDTALVMTGVTRREYLTTDIQPTYVLDSVAQIPTIGTDESCGIRTVV